MTDQAAGLRDLYAVSVQPDLAHVEEDVWERLALGGAPAAEREHVLDHVVRCAECASIYRALAEVESGARAFDPGAPDRPVLSEADLDIRLRPWGFVAGLAAAAAVVWALARPAIAPVPSPNASSEIVRGAGVVRPRPLEPAGKQLTAPASFRWEAQPGARAHRVELFDASGEALWTSAEAAGTSVAWPPELTAKAGNYYWQVVALPTTGRAADAVASSLVSFEIAGP